MAGQVWLINKRKRKGAKVAVKKRRSSKKSRSRKGRKSKSTKFKRNPIRVGGFAGRVIERQVKPALIQASGGLLVDAAFGFGGQYLPPALTTGMARHLTKGLGAVLISLLVGNFVKSETANKLAVGSLTITIHDAAKEMIATMFPTMPMGFFSPAVVSGSRGGLGYFVRKPLALPTAGGPRFSGVSRRGGGMGMVIETPQNEAFDTSAI